MKRIVSVLVVCAVVSAQAEVKLAGIFGDNMMLQRERAVPVWGWADGGEEVTVAFGGQKKSAVAGDSGKWTIKLDSMEASSTPAVMVVTSSKSDKKIEIKNILVGDIWICSGQSNMEQGLGMCLEADKETAVAKYPAIRLINFERHEKGPAVRDDIRYPWSECTPTRMRQGGWAGFSGVGYFFGRKLHKDLGVPIGLIGSNWGGTRVEPWTPPEGFRLVPELKGISAKLDACDPKTEAGRKSYRKVVDGVKAWVPKAESALADGRVPPSLPGMPRTGDEAAIYNCMIAPITDFAIRGAIWYQGESNGGEGESYFHKKTALIKGWRKLWGYDFPFYFVQLANFRKASDQPGSGEGWAKLREAQRKTLTIPKTGMAVIVDIGNPRDIHPRNKQDVGQRLALWALANEYGKEDLVCSGPLYKGMKVEGNKIRLSFDHCGSGLMVGKKEGLAATVEVADGKLARFAIAGEDRKFAWADAVIDGDTVVVSSDRVAAPVAVRYAFCTNPEGCNLYNKEGLPASPFRTDAW